MREDLLAWHHEGKHVGDRRYFLDAENQGGVWKSTREAVAKFLELMRGWQMRFSACAQTHRLHRPDDPSPGQKWT